MARAPGAVDLARALEATLSMDEGARREAQLQLDRCLDDDGTLQALLRLAAGATAAPPHVQQAAAIALKNALARGWQAAASRALCEPNRSELKALLPDALAAAPPLVLAPLGEAFRLVGASEWPERWQAAVPALLGALGAAAASGGGAGALVGPLLGLYALARRFQWPSREAAARAAPAAPREADAFVAAAGPALCALAEALLPAAAGAGAAGAEARHALALALKIWCRLLNTHLPAAALRRAAAAGAAGGGAAAAGAARSCADEDSLLARAVRVASGALAQSVAALRAAPVAPACGAAATDGGALERRCVKLVALAVGAHARALPPQLVRCALEACAGVGAVPEGADATEWDERLGAAAVALALGALGAAAGDAAAACADGGADAAAAAPLAAALAAAAPALLTGAVLPRLRLGAADAARWREDGSGCARWGSAHVAASFQIDDALFSSRDAHGCADDGAARAPRRAALELLEALAELPATDGAADAAGGAGGDGAGKPKPKLKSKPKSQQQRQAGRRRKGRTLGEAVLLPLVHRAADALAGAGAAAFAAAAPPAPGAAARAAEADAAAGEHAVWLAYGALGAALRGEGEAGRVRALVHAGLAATTAAPAALVASAAAREASEARACARLACAAAALWATARWLPWLSRELLGQALPHALRCMHADDLRLDSDDDGDDDDDDAAASARCVRLAAADFMLSALSGSEPMQEALASADAASTLGPLLDACARFARLDGWQAAAPVGAAALDACAASAALTLCAPLLGCLVADGWAVTDSAEAAARFGLAGSILQVAARADDDADADADDDDDLAPVAGGQAAHEARSAARLACDLPLLELAERHYAPHAPRAAGTCARGEFVAESATVIAALCARLRAQAADGAAEALQAAAMEPRVWRLAHGVATALRYGADPADAAEAAAALDAPGPGGAGASADVLEVGVGAAEALLSAGLCALRRAAAEPAAFARAPAGALGAPAAVGLFGPPPADSASAAVGESCAEALAGLWADVLGARPSPATGALMCAAAGHGQLRAHAEACLLRLALGAPAAGADAAAVRVGSSLPLGVPSSAVALVARRVGDALAFGWPAGEAPPYAACRVLSVCVALHVTAALGGLADADAARPADEPRALSLFLRHAADAARAPAACVAGRHAAATAAQAAATRACAIYALHAAIGATVDAASGAATSGLSEAATALIAALDGESLAAALRGALALALSAADGDVDAGATAGADGAGTDADADADADAADDTDDDDSDSDGDDGEESRAQMLKRYATQSREMQRKHTARAPSAAVSGGAMSDGDRADDDDVDTDDESEWAPEFGGETDDGALDALVGLGRRHALSRDYLIGWFASWAGTHPDVAAVLVRRSLVEAAVAYARGGEPLHAAAAAAAGAADLASTLRAAL